MPDLRRRWLARRAWWGAHGYRAATADVGEYRVHWVEGGRGDECVVLLHGLSGSSRWWQRNVEALGARRRLLVPDVIGFGMSRLSGPLPRIQEIADVLAEWSARAAGGRAHWVGHSMGGHLSAHLAARHPEAVGRLVLVDAVGIPRPLTPRAVMRFVYEVSPPTRWGDPRFLPVIWGDALVAGPFTVAQGLRAIMSDDVRPLLPSIAAPTLVVWGEHDYLVPLEHGRAMRDAIPGARLAVIAGAHHNPMIDRPDEFNALVSRFLSGEQVGE